MVGLVDWGLTSHQQLRSYGDRTSVYSPIRRTGEARDRRPVCVGTVVCPFHLTSAYGGQRIVVSDNGINQVTCLDVDGGVIFIYKDRELKVPTSLVADGHGSIYIISQYTGTVHQISENGDKLGITLSDKDGLRWPGGIAFDNWNNSLILQANGFEDKMQTFVLKE